MTMTSIVLITLLWIAISASSGYLRRDQGRSGGLPRPLCFTGYSVVTFVPLIVPYFIMMQMPEIGTLLMFAVYTALIVVPHAGPQHGEQMDMGNMSGKLSTDILGMLARFMIPVIVGAILMVLHFQSLYPIIMLLAGAVPVLTYYISFKMVKVKGTHTEISEWVYPPIYHGIINAVVMPLALLSVSI